MNSDLRKILKTSTAFPYFFHRDVLPPGGERVPRSASVRTHTPTRRHTHRRLSPVARSRPDASSMRSHFLSIPHSFSCSQGPGGGRGGPGAQLQTRRTSLTSPLPCNSVPPRQGHKKRQSSGRSGSSIELLLKSVVKKKLLFIYHVCCLLFVRRSKQPPVLLVQFSSQTKRPVSCWLHMKRPLLSGSTSCQQT